MTTFESHFDLSDGTSSAARGGDIVGSPATAAGAVNNPPAYTPRDGLAIEHTPSHVHASTCSHPAGQLEPGALSRVTADELRDAEARADLCRQYLKLMASGLSGQQAARVLGVGQSRFSGRGSWLARWQSGGVHALVTRVSDKNARDARNAADLGLTPERLEAACARMRVLYLASNYTSTRGSVPDAATRFASESACPAAMRELIRYRMSHCLPPLPTWLARKVISAAPVVRSARSPRDANLRFITAPGSAQLMYDPVTGEERRIRAGEFWTIDDGTLNFTAWLPLEDRSSPCFRKFGCIVGRFQLLLIADHASYFLPGFSYTGRIGSTYRAEDLLATMHTAFIEHGVPGIGMILEKGISAANSIEQALRGISATIWRANTPHAKVVEFIFGWLWTRLSHIPGQVGRYGGDEESISRLVERCRQGYEDPRNHFWPISKVVIALREAIVGWNNHTVSSRQWGQWIPAEEWRRSSAANLRPIEPSAAWLFAPHTTQPLVIRSSCINCQVPIMDGMSLRFSFSCGGLLEHYGARVLLHINPFAPDRNGSIQAMVTLAEPHNGLRAGHILGFADQINRYCAHTRRALCYGEDSDIGKRAYRRAGQELRRVVVSIRDDGSVGHQTADARDAAGNSATIQTTPQPTTANHADCLSLTSRAVHGDLVESGSDQVVQAGDVVALPQINRCRTVPKSFRLDALVDA